MRRRESTCGILCALIAATDPVAHESVMADCLIAERTAQGRELRSHLYLHDAMELYGLGIHEHRDPASGRYRRIDCLQVDTSKPGSPSRWKASIPAPTAATYCGRSAWWTGASSTSAMI